ncbi:MAG: DUF1822 family protein [Leptolyngbyaceae cyanobacterium CRU_2_3]|nr:DUF1822 family protein [Leptolyngbyaceae cyanobacterium CRU_2_3]
MDNTQQPACFTVPLTTDAHRCAQAFYQHHAQPQKAKQIYLNTLSVHAVYIYLSCLGIETDWQQSQSWNPTLQVLADTADLWVNQRGRLECRPVLPEMQDCSIPVEVWADRIGYMMVQLNAELTEATLLGFVPTVESETVLLKDLHSLSEFPQFLSQVTLSPVQPSPAESGAIPPVPIVLRQWLTQWIDIGWQTLESIQQSLQVDPEQVDPEQVDPEFAYSFRQAPSHTIDTSESAVNGIKQGKILSLQNIPEGRLLLLVGIVPSVNLSEFQIPEFQITVELLPTRGQRYLPRSLQLITLDATGQVVLQADGSNSEGLEFQFSGAAGERFTLQICWQDIQIEEVFEI